MTAYERQGMFKTVRSSGFCEKSVQDTRSQPHGTSPFDSLRFDSTPAGSQGALKAFVVSFYSMDREQTNPCPESGSLSRPPQNCFTAEPEVRFCVQT